MSIDNLRSLIEECYLGGKNSIVSFRKVPAIASSQGSVVDFSMSPGNPRPNYYTGAELTSTAFETNYGMWHGGNVAPATKILRKVDFMIPPVTISPAQFFVLDYLMFYPLIDMDSTDEQTLTNSITLPRYPTGNSIRAFLVATNPYIGGAAFTMTYINQDGVRKQTRLQYSNTNTFIGTLVHSGTTAGVSGTFINTPDGDGIRYVESITFLAPNGGLAALVLCKVLTTLTTGVAGAPNQMEWDCLTMKSELPIVKDGAYLNIIGQVNGSAAGIILSGLIETVWN